MLLNPYSVEVYHPKWREAWDAFVLQSKNSSFLFRRDFMEYHEDRFDDFSLLVFKDNDLLALLPANRVADKLYSHLGLTYGGLVLGQSIRFEEVLNCYYALLGFLCSQSITSLYIKEIPSIYCLLPAQEQHYLNFILKAQLYRRDALSVIDNRYRLQFSKSRQEGIKRAKKQALEIKNDDAFEAFWNLVLIPNLMEKHGASPVHTLAEMLYLKRCFPQNIKQYNVYHQGQIVAGTTIFETDTVAHCQYISGNRDKNRLGSLDFLHAYLIETVYAHKPYFDFGTSNENQGKTINAGLQFWKEGFGARTVTQDFYKIETKNFIHLKAVLI